MFDRPDRFRSVSAWQLEETGTASTSEALMSAVHEMSDAALQNLEDELEFCRQTGLVGLQMSRLLTLLRLDGLNLAA